LSIADSELLVKLIFTIVSFMKIIVNSFGQDTAQGVAHLSMRVQEVCCALSKFIRPDGAGETKTSG
jgi:hypothetical protein